MTPVFVPANSSHLSLRVLLVEQGCEVTVAGDGPQGFEAYQQHSFDVVRAKILRAMFDHATQVS